MQSDVIDAYEVARQLGVSYRTVINLTNSGEIPGFKVGNQFRYRQSDIEKYIQDQLDRREEKK